MRKGVRFALQFVDYIPAQLKERTLYVSMEFATATHLCPCGCGSEVVTPLSPTDWSLVFDGESVSLDPSVGNWTLPCQSHYWIRKSQVLWARQWTRDEIEAGRRADRSAKLEYYGRGQGSTLTAPTDQEEDAPVGLLASVGKWFRTWLRI